MLDVEMFATPISVERKTLQTIQLNSNESHLTRPGEQLKSVKETKKDDKPKAKISLSHKPLQVFEDPAPSSGKSSPKSPSESAECECQCHHKSEEDQMLEFMTQETSANDWRNIAEERREALEESLVENRQLHFEVSEFKTQLTGFVQEVTDLKDENRRLSQQRDYFANILQTLMNDDNDTPPSANDSSCSSDADVSGDGDLDHSVNSSP